ncbi:hypothetical protein Tco_0793318 [Tanacetum coccineum]
MVIYDGFNGGFNGEIRLPEAPLYALIPCEVNNDDRKMKNIIAIILDTSLDNINSDSNNNSSDSDNNSSDSDSTSQISTSEEIDYSSPKYKGPHKSLLKWYNYLSDEYKDKFWGSKSKAKVKASMAQASLKTLIVKSHVPITNCVIGLANAKTCTYKDTTNKDSTDEDTILECYSPMSKGKYVPVSKKHNPKVKNPIPMTRCMLGIANDTTWDDM